MEMNFNLSPGCMAEVGELLHEGLIVLLRRRKIRVIEPLAFSLSKYVEISRILSAPRLKPLFLNIPRRIFRQRPRHATRLEMVSNRDEKVDGAARSPARHSLPCIAGQA